MRKNVLMPRSFVLNVYQLLFFLLDYELDSHTSEVFTLVESQLKDKLDAIDRHDSFSKYKSAPPGSSDRDSLRRDYIQKAGFHPDWCSKIETQL